MMPGILRKRVPGSENDYFKNMGTVGMKETSQNGLNLYFIDPKI